MQPVKNWGVERRETKDPRTGRRVWQLTGHAAAARHLRFTRPSWCPAWPRPLFVSDRGGAANLCTFDEDWAVLQLSDLAGQVAAPNAASLRLAVFDPTGGGVFLPGSDVPPGLWRHDFESGRTELVQPGAAGGLTCDGRYSVAVAPSPGAGGSVRSRLVRCDLQSGERVDVHEEDGEVVDLLGSPVDAELVIWVNPRQCVGRKLHVSTGRAGAWVDYRVPEQAHHHFSFVPQSSLILTAYEDGGRTCWQVLDPDGRRMDHFGPWDGQGIVHASASHGRRLVVGDTWRPVGGGAGARPHQLLTYDRIRKQSSVLCSVGSGGDQPPAAGSVVPPEPVFSPDDRQVLFAAAGGAGGSQLYLVEL